MEQCEKMYLYKRIEQTKLFMDNHYAKNIDLFNIAMKLIFQNFTEYSFINLSVSPTG